MPELAPHQVEAAQRAIALLDRYGGAILADDVGLGKSYVAAAVAREVDLPRIEVIVPASLVGQWRDTLDAFGVDAEILTHDALANDARIGTGRRLLIVDEAHAFRNRRTQRWRALARRSVAARLLLVTATPVCNTPLDLHALVSLIAADDALRAIGVASIDDAFAANDRCALDSVVGELVIRRERDVLPSELRFGALERRVIRHRVPDVPIGELRFPLSNSAPLLRQFLQRRLESSPAAFAESVCRQLRFYERVIESGRPLSRADYRRAFAADEEAEAVQQMLFWDLVAPREPIDLDAVREEMARLTAMRSAVEAAGDEKASVLEEALAADGEPALIFTGSAATARALARRLRCGLATSRDGTAAVEAFRRGAIDRVVATDLASEGLNLQRAGVVVHYDIPWNPVRLDQRNGRAHRIGQRRDAVRAIYFLPEQRSRIVEVVARKNRTRRRILAPQCGGLPPVIGLPPRLPHDAPALALARTIRSYGLAPPPALFRRYRAGVELLFEEMAGEYIDAHRLRELEALLQAESSRRAAGDTAGQRPALRGAVS